MKTPPVKLALLKKQWPWLTVLLLVAFVLTNRRQIHSSTGDDAEGSPSVLVVPEIATWESLAWRANADKFQSASFPCDPDSSEEYKLDIPTTYSSGHALWSIMSTVAGDKGKQRTVALESPCGRKGAAKSTVFLRMPATDIDVYFQVFKQHFLKMLYPLVDSDTKIEYILDGGANCGMTTLILASLFPSSVIVSVEPDPQNFAILKKNTEHLSNVRLVQAGLWDETGKIALKGNHGQWGRVFKRVDDDDEDGMQAFSISDVMQKYDIPRFDLVKMDIEGSEAVVLGGHGDVSWLEDVKVFFAEVHDMFAGYFGLSKERQDVTEIVERVVSKRMHSTVRMMDNEHTLYFAKGVLPDTPV
jgi:FkbM family methyltransferase